jgi:hypothetical protein
VTSWPDFALGFCAGICATLVTMLALRHTEGQPEPEPDLSFIGSAEEKLRDG